MADPASVGSTEEWRPAPSDPSHATSDIIRREIAHLSDRIDLKIEGVVTAQTARLDGIEKAAQVFSDNLNRVPTAVDRAVSAQVAVTDEKFAKLEVSLHALRVAFDKSERVTQEAVSAALSAAEKATSKQAESFSEAAEKASNAFTKAIDQQAALYQTETRALRDISNTQDRRITAIESMNLGGQTAKGEQHGQSTLAVAIVAAVIAFVSMAVAAGALLHNLAAK